MVPETWQGKVIASFCALLGISFFALPAVSVECTNYCEYIHYIALYDKNPIYRMFEQDPVFIGICWMVFFFSFTHSSRFHMNIGNIGQWFRPKSTTATTTKAHDSPTTTCSYFNSIPVAMLCRRRTFNVDCNLENPSSAITITTSIVSIQ